jgi:hypothetical protein
VRSCDTHRFDKVAKPSTRRSGNDTSSNETRFGRGAASDDANEGTRKVVENVPKAANSNAAKSWHLRRVPTCTSTCHGQTKNSHNRNIRCARRVEVGKVQPAYYGDISIGKDNSGMWKVRPGWVWFCLDKTCVSKRHQKGVHSPVPEEWPVAVGTNLTLDETHTTHHVGFKVVTRLCDPGESRQGALSHVYNRLRWGKVQPRPKNTHHPNGVRGPKG